MRIAMDSLRLLPFVVVAQLVWVAVVSQPDFLFSSCTDTNGSYTSGSSYELNLKTALSEISSNTQIDYGFYNFSFGEESNKADVIGLCRGDIGLTDCHTCLNNSIYKLPETCPNKREAIGWYDDVMLRYSDRSILDLREDNPTTDMFNVNNASDVNQFNSVLGELLGSLQKKAASGDSRLKYATGEQNVTAFMKVYAFVQCTPDLSTLDCFNCLGVSINHIPSCCAGKLGGRVYRPSCNLNYEIYQFVNSAHVSSPSPPTSIDSGFNQKRNAVSRNIVAVAVSVVASLFLVSIIIFFGVRRRARKRKTWLKLNNKVDANDKEEITSTESLRFDFSTIAAATDSFSEANKLGRGGFGDVYKGILSGENEIAVKRLSRNSGQGENEFKNEVVLLAKLQHRNLVRPLGFCFEGDERVLIYEFVPNKSLDYVLFDDTMNSFLDWQTRYKIIGGIARRLLTSMKILDSGLSTEILKPVMYFLILR